MAVENFGVLSLAPPLLAIALAIITRRAMLSLFVGIWFGGLVFVGGADISGLLADPAGWVMAAINGGLGIPKTFEWITTAIGGSTFNATILVFTMLLGAGIALLWKLGGAMAITRFATKRIDSHRKIGVSTWLLGILWNFDDYANNAIVGSSMKNLADELRMSREKLAYILDSTAAPVATIGISSWVAFEIGLINTQYQEMGIANEVPSAATTFVQSIPYNMYSILAVMMVGIIVVSGRDFGEMLDAENRSVKTGNVIRENANPLQSIKEDLGQPVTDEAPLRMFALPVTALVATVIGGAFIMGYAPDRTLVQMVENTAVATALVWGSFAMVATAVILGLTHDYMDIEESMETVLKGFGTMLPAVSILVLAWSIGAVATALGTGTYVTNFAEGVVSPLMVPVVIFGTSAFIAFAIGTSWGTMGIMTPITIPMAWEIGGNNPQFLAVALGAMFSGAVFGDNCSPISDTTVLASTFAGSDHIDHVRTQMYYAVTVLIATSFIYFLWGVTNLSPFVLLPLGVVILGVLVYAFSELDARRKDLDATPGRGYGRGSGVPSDD